MKKYLHFAVISGIISLSGCSMLSSLIPSPGVNANVQAGKENTQQAVVNQENIKGENVTVSKVEGGNSMEVKEIGALHQNIQNIPPWVLLLLVLGWLLPSPQEIWTGLMNLIFRVKRGS